MKNEETGRISYYTAKKEVVYTSLLMCENAPQEWLNVPAENIRRFQKSARYKRADNKDAALGKFKLTFQKQRLWNEVLKIEKTSDAQLGRSFEFSLGKGIASLLQEFVTGADSFGQLSNRISNSIISEIVYWLIAAIVMGILFIMTGLPIVWIGYQVGKIYRKFL